MRPGINTIAGDLSITANTVRTAVFAHLPALPPIASEWFVLGDAAPAYGPHWIRTGYVGLSLLRIAFGPYRIKAREWHAAAARSAADLQVVGRTPSEAFTAACEALRAEGWLLPGPDVPPGYLEAVAQSDLKKVKAL